MNLLWIRAWQSVTKKKTPGNLRRPATYNRFVSNCEKRALEWWGSSTGMPLFNGKEPPQMMYWACQQQGGSWGGTTRQSQLTWRGSHTDKSQFTQGAVTLDDIFTGWLYSSFDNAPATPFISLKDEREAENVISPLRQEHQWLRIKREGGAS